MCVKNKIGTFVICTGTIIQQLRKDSLVIDDDTRRVFSILNNKIVL